MGEHLRYIKHPSQYDKSTGRHFSLPNHNANDFSCKIIQINSTKPKGYDPQGIEREEYWIDKVKSQTPGAINDKVSRHKVCT